MKRLILCLALAGCVGDPELAVISVVHCEPRGGSADCVTIVETTDHRRYIRSDRWGAVGDTVLIQARQQGWETPRRQAP